MDLPPPKALGDAGARPAAIVQHAETLEQALYEVRKKIYPRAVHGWFAAWRWALVWVTQLVFYGGAVLAIAAVGLAFTPWFPTSGLETVACIAAVAAGVFGMWRVWRDEHTYGY